MRSSDDLNVNNTIGNAIYRATVHLTVPTVTATGSMSMKLRSQSASNDSLEIRQTGFNLASLSISFPKHSHLNKRKVVRDSTPQLISHKSISNLEPMMVSSSTSTIKYHQHRRATSCSPRKHNKSIKNTLYGILQGLNHNEIPSPIPHTYERTRKTAPKWRAFTKVVVTLLAFTRTKKDRYEWIQLVGHPGTFKEGIHDGYILKEMCESERDCCQLLQHDALKYFVPKYNGTIKDEEGKFYIEIEDLLSSFHEPCIMDCKIGVRTYLEDELDKSERDPKPRADLYNKMIAIDPSAPTEQENEEKKILKSRYMIWRESLSSTEELGFRIEAIKKSRGLMSKEFQRIKERNAVKQQFYDFIAYSSTRAISYLHRLIGLRSACSRSKFLETHELIGSSLLFVHDETKASIWMIDFGKTRLLPDNIHITHLEPWIRGSHEDGYLFGIDSLISIFQEIVDELKL